MTLISDFFDNPFLINSFFNKNYETPQWMKEKNWYLAKTSRRNLLKSAAGATAIAALPARTFTRSAQSKMLNDITQEPWLTLDATLNHLFPASPSGPSAKDIQALPYLYNVVNIQPTEQTEIDFIKKGVGWLNGYSESQLNKKFIELNNNETENMLRAISRSQAGENWLSTLISYIFEAMLLPPSYGGNPEGIGWQWLQHQAGFPLPPIGKRYYELPGQQAIPFQEVPIRTAMNKLNTSSLSSVKKTQRTRKS